MTLEQLNLLDPDACADALRQCCACTRWVEGMMAQRPFATHDEVIESADRIWATLSMPDYLEAFDAHPRIGDIDSLKARYADTKALATGEQAGTGGASDEVLNALAAGNSEYEQRFGFIFIVCATGRSAEEMLKLLNERLNNDLISELAIAAAEQARITRLRLDKLLDKGNACAEPTDA